MRILGLIAVVGLAFSMYAQSPQRAVSSPPPQPNSGAAKERSGYDPLLDLPPLPQAKLTLIGGTVAKIDPIQDRMEVRDFGGGKTNIAFDMRTKILRDGAPATVKDIQPGSRVYLDTMLNGDQVFAKTIRVETGPDQGDARGQVVAVDTGRGILNLQEQIAPEPFQLRLTPQTAAVVEGRPAGVAEVLPGALVTVSFTGAGEASVVREIRVLANPGQSFTFVGEITFLDLRLKRLAIANQSDNQTHDLALDQLPPGQIRGLRVGADAVVQAVFNGKSYEARSVELNTPAKNPSPQ